MVSDIVYLFGHLFAPEVNWLHFREELPNGKKVDQKKLAHQLVLAALVSLYQEKAIDLFLQEGKMLFFKTTTVKIQKKKDVSGLVGLEKEIAKKVKDTESVKDVVMMLVPTSENPWEEITKIVRRQLREEERLNPLSEKENKDAEKKFLLYTEILKELKAKGELLPKLHEAIREGLGAKEEKERGESGE